MPEDRPVYRGSGHPGQAVDRRPGAAERLGPGPKDSLRMRGTAILWNAIWGVFRRLPAAAAFRLAHLLALVGLRCRPQQRAQVRANLARVVPPEELDKAVRDAFISYGRYYVEAFRAADFDPVELDAATTTEGFEHLDAVLEEGRGAIVLLAHHGSWDTAAAWAESHGYHLAVVAEVLRPRALFAKFVRLRESIGLEVVPLQRGDNLGGRLKSVLAANHMTGLLSDRDLTNRAPVVDFFGEPSRIPAGPVVLSRRTGAPVVPVTMLQRPGRRWHVVALEPVDVSKGSTTDGCQALAHALESLIRLDPAQWHAFGPVWLADQPAHRRPEAQQAQDAQQTAESGGESAREAS